MTLIIGCITKDFAIIGGDTQLSSGDLRRGKIRRSVQHKVQKCSNDFMLGVLGCWTWYHKVDEHNTLRYDEDEYILEKLRDSKIRDKLSYLKQFINSKQSLKATVIYIKALEKGFELGSVSTIEEVGAVRNEAFEDLEIIYNECFYKAKNDFVQKLIIGMREEYQLTNSLTDSLFLVNNIILEVIALGKNVPLPVEGEPYQEITNSVGGYVTIQVSVHKSLNYPNNLFLCYRRDINTLLDKITFPFSVTVFENTCIIYIDNLSMLIKSYRRYFNKNIKDSLLDLIVKQVMLINKKNILDTALLNRLIEFINNKYEIGIEPLDISVEVTTIEVGDLLCDGFDNDVIIDFEYLKRFF